MAPKKTSSSSTATGIEKRKVVRKTIDFKKELIAKYEEDVRVSELAREYGMAKSTISTILKNFYFLCLIYCLTMQFYV